MVRKYQSSERLARASKAMAELEGFWDRFSVACADDRGVALSDLESIRVELADASLGDRYVVERLSKLARTCRLLARIPKPRGYDEKCTVVDGLADVKLIRAELRYRRLLESSIRPDATQYGLPVGADRNLSHF